VLPPLSGVVDSVAAPSPMRRAPRPRAAPSPSLAARGANVGRSLRSAPPSSFAPFLGRPSPNPPRPRPREGPPPRVADLLRALGSECSTKSIRPPTSVLFKFKAASAISSDANSTKAIPRDWPSSNLRIRTAVTSPKAAKTFLRSSSENALGKFLTKSSLRFGLGGTRHESFF
jgi:hypothetical protein